MTFRHRLMRGLCRFALVAGLSAGVTTHAVAADTYTQTRYPVVLVHGAFGFDAIGPVSYWYGIVSALRSGGATVYTPSVSGAETSEARGEQLLRQLRSYKAAYGHQKFNLIGHSHGGPTARYVAAVAPDLVASVTTVGSPHAGSKVADAIETVTSWTGTTGFAATLANGLAATIAFLSGSPTLPQDALGSLKSLSTRGAADFNRRFPQGKPTSSCGQGPASVNGIRYWSVGGTSVATNILDVSDGLLVASSVVFGFEQNDGLVSQCSSHWGTVLKDNYAWNHLDEVNQAFGLRGIFSQDPVAFYRSQANRIKSAGL
ncbi:triacylglycerol lipase [Rhizobacter sp. J219]|jgi:triacylglycerol lipase|uniref:esterase/lipase family protein n=1 Tax=Rhizobacter sp. J219 TaxID=2898430 RepID=UPI002151C28B|nr:triacylglycerol lipase [Rhizobacter sp. J219]MCR5884962.1 triacylglycerol lipase [Rhizobacter sp. J219]